MTITISFFPKTKAAIKSYFKRHIIITSKYHPPAVLINDFTNPKNGFKYCKVKYNSSYGMREVHIRDKNVISAVKSDSKFMIHLRKIGLLNNDTATK